MSSVRVRLFVAATLLLLAGGAPAALAHPTRAHDATPGTLRIDIDRITPLAPVQMSTVTVSGTVTNTGTTPVYAGSMSLVYTGYATSRTGLQTFEAMPGTAGIQMTATSLPKQLAAGQRTGFTLSVPIVSRFFERDLAVQELSVVASAAVTKGTYASPLGVTAVPVPYFWEPIKAKLRTALIIPVTAVPDQGPVPEEGSPVQPASPSLMAALQPQGRLGKLLSVIEAAPAAGGTGGTQVTVAIDPALLDRVCALAQRCGKDRPEGTTPTDTATAGDWLKRLLADVELPGVTVVGLPYADADLAALSAAGDTTAVVALLEQARAKVTTVTGGATTTDLSPLLPVDGLADPSLAAAAVQAGSTVAVLDSTQFAPFVPGAGQTVTPTANTTLTTDAGNIPALLTDPILESMLSPTASDPASPRLEEQLLLAEFAVINSEAPNYSVSRTVVLEAPRDWDVSTSFSVGLVNALGAVPYISSEGLSTIESAPPVLRTRLATPPKPTSSPLPAAAISLVDAARPTVAALHSVAVNPGTETLSGPFGDGLDRSLSAWWRGANAKQGAALLASVTNDLTNTMKLISVKGGEHGVLLTGPSGTLPVQVNNELSEAIRIIVHVKTDGLEQVSGRDVSQTFQPSRSSYQVGLTITTRSTRSVDVNVQLLSQSTGDQVAAATIPVRSTSVGKVAVGITAAALTLLVLLIVVRGIRRFAAHRRSQTAPTAARSP